MLRLVSMQRENRLVDWTDGARVESVAAAGVFIMSIRYKTNKNLVEVDNAKPFQRESRSPLVPQGN